MKDLSPDSSASSRSQSQLWPEGEKSGLSREVTPSEEEVSANRNGHNEDPAEDSDDLHPEGKISSKGSTIAQGQISAGKHQEISGAGAGGDSAVTEGARVGETERKNGLEQRREAGLSGEKMQVKLINQCQLSNPGSHQKAQVAVTMKEAGKAEEQPGPAAQERKWKQRQGEGETVKVGGKEGGHRERSREMGPAGEEKEVKSKLVSPTSTGRGGGHGRGVREPLLTTTDVCIEINDGEYLSVFIASVVESVVCTSVHIAQRKHLLKVAVVNSKGIVSKMAIIQNMLVDGDLDVLGITETLLQHDRRPKVPGYNFHMFRNRVGQSVLGRWHSSPHQ